MSVASILVILWALGAVVVHFLEGWSWIDSFYFAAVTLTTVGYGDFTVKTQFGKMFVTAFLLVGVAMFLYGINVLAQHYVQKREDQIEHSHRQLEGIVGKNKESRASLRKSLSGKEPWKIRK